MSFLLPLEPLICGNESVARNCPANYSCLGDIGKNPDFGYTSFDNFGFALLSMFRVGGLRGSLVSCRQHWSLFADFNRFNSYSLLQLITLDYWEDVYNKILASAGTPSVIFFICVIFFGSYYIIKLVLAVVAMSYSTAVRHVHSASRFCTS